MKETMNTILTRRSTRKFLNRPIPEEELQQIYDELEFQMSRLKERFNGKQAFSLGADSGVVPCKCSHKIPKNLLN